ncbi:hypothetical protein ACLOJK_006335 [Asimina triloba]
MKSFPFSAHERPIPGLAFSRWPGRDGLLPAIRHPAPLFLVRLEFGRGVMGLLLARDHGHRIVAGVMVCGMAHVMGVMLVGIDGVMGAVDGDRSAVGRRWVEADGRRCGWIAGREDGGGPIGQRVVGLGCSSSDL